MSPRRPSEDYETVYERLCARWHPAIAAIEAHLYLERLAIARAVLAMAIAS